MSTITYSMPKLTFKVTQILSPLDICKLYKWTWVQQWQQQLKIFVNHLHSSFHDMRQPFKAYFHLLPHLEHCQYCLARILA